MGILRKLFGRRSGPPDAQDPGIGESVARALEHHKAGRLAEAQVLYDRALARNPGDIDALHFSGVVAYQVGRLQRAEELIARALAMNAANAPAHNNLGNVYLAQQRADEARACYQRAIELQPDYADAYVNLGSVFARQQRLDEAAACYRRGLEAAPRSAALHLGLASVLTDAGQLVEAEAGFRRALALKPDYPAAHNGLGTALLAQGRPEEAARFFQESIARKPDLAGARFGCALAKLMMGDYSEGLALYEARFDDANPVIRARLADLEHVRRWRGGTASGKSLLVWPDQGLGDMLMCLRYLPMVKQRGFSRLIVECGQPLVRIVKSMPEVDDVVPQGSRLPLGEFDSHCPMGSLPLAFATRLDTIPGRNPYVFVPGAMRNEWGKRFAHFDSLRVGVAWAGRRDFPRDALRSIPLERLAPLFDVPGIAFFSLQKGEAAAQASHAGFPIHDWMAQCVDLLDTAALMAELDLVIAVDTAIVHLAAALGRPTWLLNRFESEWRWMLEREDCAWYPTLRIFRQPEPGAWDPVVRNVADALKSVSAAARCAPRQESA